MRADDPSRVGTINGFGTGFRGWRHYEDGSSTATSWVLAGFIPVLPLRRYRLRTLTDFANEKFGTPGEVAGALLGSFSWSDPVRIEARLPLAWREIGATYLRAYVLVPLLCLWPLAIFTLVMAILRSRSGGEPIRLQQPWIGLYIAVFAGNFLAVLLTAARRTRGCPGPRREPAELPEDRESAPAA
jgi:hypothetical protein